MYINKVTIKNFRLLRDSSLDFKNKLCMMIGHNNTGKTSFMVIFEKFMKSMKFGYNDFSIYLRKKMIEIDESTNIHEFTIRLQIEIIYEESDDLSNLSEFIMDLDPDNRRINLLFECSILKNKLIDALNSNSKIAKDRFIKDYLENYLSIEAYTYAVEDDIKESNRFKLIRKEIKDIKKLIDFEIIHAKRSVSSSEEIGNRRVLSTLTTKFFNRQNKSNPEKFQDINNIIDEIDTGLGKEYDLFFKDFLKNSKDFLNLRDLKVISNLKADRITNSSEVIYGDEENNLPEYLNGLGYLNILFLLLTIEIKKNTFINNDKDIKLLFIEEPEAHTHPQLQYIFARKIEELLSDIDGLQSIITTHSSHIISNCDFENIRYMNYTKDNGNGNVKIKNFYSELKNMYKNGDEFKFVNQYLSIEASELFFASKVIFVEGITEYMLLNYFISKFDLNKIEEEAKLDAKSSDIVKYVPLSSQNISVLQVGANAKVFKEFLDFLSIKTLIITDIDTVKKNIENNFIACPVQENPESISNYTIKHYLNAPEITDKDAYKEWMKDLINNNLNTKSGNIRIAYQKLENEYHARSFEDAFISINIELIKDNIGSIFGLKNIGNLELEMDFYKLTNSILKKKSDFSSSLLYLAHSNEKIDWEIPSYIREGFEWLLK